MKKYFAKYLPVFGEIRDGDKVLYKPTGHIAEVEGELMLKQFKKKGWFYRYSKVMQFLVSKDIQVGDWVYHSEGNYGAMQSKKDTLYEVRYEKSFNSTAHIEDLVGVYGLISPKAKWIKDGDEIDGSSLGEPIEKLVVNPFAKMPVNMFIEIYPIMCPCCDTFK